MKVTTKKIFFYSKSIDTTHIINTAQAVTP
jgi:hypothetical protein